jgi:hypothetical protein
MSRKFGQLLAKPGESVPIVPANGAAARTLAVVLMNSLRLIFLITIPPPIID